MKRILTLSLVAIMLVATGGVLAADPPSRDAFHPDKWAGKEIEFSKGADRVGIPGLVVEDFLAVQTAQIRLEIEKFKPVELIREPPLSTFARGPIQVEPVHYPSVQFSAVRW